MRFELTVSVRYLLSSKLQSILLILGVAFGVTIFIFITSLINGLNSFIIKQILGNIPHITIEAKEKEPSLFIKDVNNYKSFSIIEIKDKSNNNITKNQINNWQKIEKIIINTDDILDYSPQITGNCFIRRNQNIKPIILVGVIPAKLSVICDIKNKIISGDANLNNKGVIIGEIIAKDLGLKIGQPILLQTDKGNSQTFPIHGIFKTGLEFIDKRIVYIDLKRARNLFNITDGITKIEIKVKDLWKAEEIAINLVNQIPLKILSWQQKEADIFNALTGQSYSGQIIKIFTLIIITTGISSTLLLNTYRRKVEIGIMRSFGTTKTFIAKVFLLQSILIGLIGSILGCLVGYIICTILYNIKFPNGQPVLPIIPEDGGYVSVIIAVIIGSVLAGILPAREATKIDPVRVINQ